MLYKKPTCYLYLNIYLHILNMMCVCYIMYVSGKSKRLQTTSLFIELLEFVADLTLLSMLLIIRSIIIIEILSQVLLLLLGILIKYT